MPKAPNQSNLPRFTWERWWPGLPERQRLMREGRPTEFFVNTKWPPSRYRCTLHERGAGPDGCASTIDFAFRTITEAKERAIDIALSRE